MRLIDADQFEVIAYKDTAGRENTFDAGVQYMAELIDAAPTVWAYYRIVGDWTLQEKVFLLRHRLHDNDTMDVAEILPLLRGENGR